VRAWLSRERVAFVEKNVEEDDAGYEELLALRFRTVPVTVVPGHPPIRGYDEAALLAALRPAGRLPPDR